MLRSWKLTVFAGAALAVAIAAVLARFFMDGRSATENRAATSKEVVVDKQTAEHAPVRKYPRMKRQAREKGARVWSVQELSLHNGTDNKKSLLLAILGEVFDVGSGAQFYGLGRDYAGAAGLDNSVAFHTGEFSSAPSPVSNLPARATLDITGWRDFYRNHETYRFVGFLHDVYYDADGNPTKELEELNELSADGKIQSDMNEELRDQHKGCNTRVVQKEAHVDIWCDDSYHPKGSLPVYMKFEVPGGGKLGPLTGARCVCIQPAVRAAMEAATHIPGTPQVKFIDYPECGPGEQRCKRPKNNPPPG